MFRACPSSMKEVGSLEAIVLYKGETRDKYATEQIHLKVCTGAASIKFHNVITVI